MERKTAGSLVKRGGRKRRGKLLRPARGEASEEKRTTVPLVVTS